MTDQRDKAIDEPAGGVVLPSQAPEPVSVTRRMLLRGATATVPTILTLSSGAALARSSNLLGTVQSANGDVLCLNPASTQGATMQNPNVYDLGTPAYGEVTRMPVGHRYRNKLTQTDVTAPEACKLDGTLQIKYSGSGPWVDKTKRLGVMVSNAAVTSFGSRITITDI